MNNIEGILQEKAVRITPMRQLLLEYFIQEDKVVGLGELEKAFPRADRITLYRTLKTFAEKGIVHSIESGTSEVKYALCKAHCTEARHIDRHPHFLCLKCHQISCLDTVFIPQMELPEGYQFQQASMIIKGVCKECT